MDLEGDSKQIEKRVEQTARSEGQRALDTSDSIAKGWFQSNCNLQLHIRKRSFSDKAHVSWFKPFKAFLKPNFFINFLDFSLILAWTHSKAESKITGSAELQLLQTRLNSLAEEMRLSIENSKRWADQERERTNREMNDNIRDALATIERDSKDLKVRFLFDFWLFNHF